MKLTTKEILNITHHRPWPLSQDKWKYYQEWNNSIFLHWQVDFDELSNLVHPDLEIDLFEGKPWVSLVAFDMEKIRPKSLPSASLISNFPEINIRTYVKYNGKSGVYFLSIEGAKRLSCNIAKSVSDLPYRFSTMSRKINGFNSVNRKMIDSFKMSYFVGDKIEEKRDLDHWLVERFALFQDSGKYINEFQIHHIEWPLYKVQLNELEISYPRFEKLLNNSPDEKHYSTGVQVIAWAKKKNRMICITNSSRI
ncbi:MAG: hypothetical protein COA32_10205 [Fluviicola sp.]|nr:MAG: hypothetical protein COA32_10205 [Fluviicola sp.]